MASPAEYRLGSLTLPRLIPDGDRHGLRLDESGCATPSDASSLKPPMILGACYGSQA
jgi:hypothetical protein